MKRFLSCIMAFALLLGLCGCGEKEPVNPGPEVKPVFEKIEDISIEDVRNSLRLSDFLKQGEPVVLSNTVNIFFEDPAIDDYSFNTINAYKHENGSIISYFNNDDPEDGSDRWYGFDGISGLTHSYGEKWQIVYNGGGGFTSEDLLFACENEDYDWNIEVQICDDEGLFNIGCTGFFEGELFEELLVIIDPLTGLARSYEVYHYSTDKTKPFLTEAAVIEYTSAKQIDFNPTDNFENPHTVKLHYGGQDFEIIADDGTQLSFVDEISTANGGVMEYTWYCDEAMSQMYSYPDWGFIGTVTEDLELWGQGVWSETYPEYGYGD